MGESAALAACPRSQRPIPVDPGYITWCDACGWNASPSDDPPPGSLFALLYLRAGRRASAQLRDSLSGLPTDQLRPRRSGAKALALLIAAATHLTTVALLALGLALVLGTDWNVVLIAAGLLCIALAWLLRPRLAPLPPHPVTRAQAPALHALVGQVAAQLGVAQAPEIIVTDEFNASLHLAGLRQRPVLSLGYPLVAILSPQERVALIAHELAHAVNGDVTRSLVVGSAIGALGRWHDLLRPDYLQQQYGRSSDGSALGCLMYFSMMLAQPIMRAIASAPWLAAYALSHLLWRDSQRAEYYADYLAATVGGTAAMLGVLEKLHYRATVWSSIQRLVLGGAASAPGAPLLLETLRRDVAQLPARELARIRRVEIHEASRLDVSHPPTPYRMGFLTSHPVDAAAVAIGAEEHARIDQELAQYERRVMRELSDRYRESIYA